MVVHRSDEIKTARADVHAAAFASGKLQIYDGTQPAAGAAITDQILLAQFDLDASPGSANGAGFTLATPLSVLVIADGIASWARLLAAGDVWAMDFDVGASNSGAALTLNPIQIYAGGSVIVNSFALLES